MGRQKLLEGLRRKRVEDELTGDELPCTDCGCTPRRTREGPERFLKGIRGYLRADAFAGYDHICAGTDVIEVACWANVRRKFFVSRTSSPMLAHAALARIRLLYKVETVAGEFSAEDRRALLQRDSVPLLTSFGEWLSEQKRRTQPKSPIGQAIAYVRFLHGLPPNVLSRPTLSSIALTFLGAPPHAPQTRQDAGLEEGI